ncbi:hypothetical protein LZC95_21745 [Pendulispora brunnea]|uniref:Lipoprotein n=1 Tax=Pendulispora brunnea TaxID=2905690 RepID=A0ABZ2KPD3_9BACT
MNAKRLLGISFALVFSTLTMACASEATMSEEESEPAAQALQTETANTGDVIAPALYCHGVEKHDPSYCHTKSSLMLWADKTCRSLGYKTAINAGYETQFCSGGKVGAVYYQCCDEG